MKIKSTTLIMISLSVGIAVVSLFWLNSRFSDIRKPQNTAAEPSTNGFQTDDFDMSTTEKYIFAVQADPHMDEQSSDDVYRQTLNHIVSDKSAFLIDLGDIFMIDKLADKSEANIKARYELMKGYYDLLGPAIPVYQVMGNHDGETGWDPMYYKDLRLSHFPDQNAGKNYYSFVRNDALFIILDPYTYTTIKPNKDGWLWTIGKEQYGWLKDLLENSKEKYKFVFMHQLVGGDSQGRGGVEFAELYEWGGNNADGTYGFDEKRPGWGKPIHQLLVENNVDIVFKGHDHFYAKQELDSLIYQTVPQPSHAGDKINTAEQYGYFHGEILGGSGYIRVAVTEEKALVQFMRADAEKTVAASYSVN